MIKQRDKFNIVRILLGIIFQWSQLGLTGCTQMMAEQPRYNPYSPSSFFSDGLSMRPQIPGTVSRGPLPSTLLVEPKVYTRAILERGRERFNINCSPCHGAAGDGHGLVPERGFISPPSFHSNDLRQASAQHFFEVITYGYGAMFSYAARVTPEDRWAIIAYIRALQLSQNFPISELPQQDKEELLKVNE